MIGLIKAEWPIAKQERRGGTSREREELELSLVGGANKTRSKWNTQNGSEVKSHVVKHRLIEAG